MQKIYGIHAVEAILKTQPNYVRMLYLQESREDQRLQSLKLLAESADIPMRWVSRRELEALLDNEASHQGVVAEIISLPTYTEQDLLKLLEIKPVTLLVLDGVQDPHNLGACLRSANALGVHAVIAPKDRAVGMTPAVRKVACGAAELTPFIAVTNLSRTLALLKKHGVWLVGADSEADSKIMDIDLSGSIALVMGAEAKGLRRLTREHCDYIAAIPMQGAIESVNVSVATGICLYEILRQRLMKEGK